MNHPIDNRLAQAKKLSADERASLIDALHDLNAPPDPEWEAGGGMDQGMRGPARGPGSRGDADL